MSLAAELVVSYPRTAEVDKHYELTIDLQHDAARWALTGEEYAIHCVVDGAPTFSCAADGDATILVHRFGGSYGPARFVLKAREPAESARVRITLLDARGSVLRSRTLDPIRVHCAQPIRRPALRHGADDYAIVIHADPDRVQGWRTTDQTQLLHDWLVAVEGAAIAPDRVRICVSALTSDTLKAHVEYTFAEIGSMLSPPCRRLYVFASGHGGDLGGSPMLLAPDSEGYRADVIDVVGNTVKLANAGRFEEVVLLMDVSRVPVSKSLSPPLRHRERPACPWLFGFAGAAGLPALADRRSPQDVGAGLFMQAATDVLALPHDRGVMASEFAALVAHRFAALRDESTLERDQVPEFDINNDFELVPPPASSGPGFRALEDETYIPASSVGWAPAVPTASPGKLDELPPQSAADQYGTGALGPITWDILWPNGSTLTVRFLNASVNLQRRVQAIIREWSRAANVAFEFDQRAAAAAIRIAFADEGSWAYRGTSGLRLPENQPTLNIGLTPDSDDDELRRVVLQKVGVVLGLVTETQSPNARIAWNPQVVYRDLAESPFHRTREQVNATIFATHGDAELQVGHHSVRYRAFDPASVMMPAFPATWTLDGLSSKENDRLSDLDIEFIRQLYPPDVDIDMQKPASDRERAASDKRSGTLRFERQLAPRESHRLVFTGLVRWRFELRCHGGELALELRPAGGSSVIWRGTTTNFSVTRSLPPDENRKWQLRLHAREAGPAIYYEITLTRVRLVKRKPAKAAPDVFEAGVSYDEAATSSMRRPAATASARKPTRRAAAKKK